MYIYIMYILCIMYICISVRITWLVSLGLLGNLSATFFSPISTKASTSFWAVASFPFRRSQRTSTSIQHSLALWKFSFAMISIEAWLNSSSRAKSFHFTPMSTGNFFAWKSASFKGYFLSQPSWFDDATKNQTAFKFGFKSSTFYF